MDNDPVSRILEVLPRLLYSIPPIFTLGKKSPDELDTAILQILDHRGPLYVKKIHAALNWNEITYKKVSARINTLQKKGLVQENEVTGRNRSKGLTPIGQNALIESQEQRKVYLKQILALLEPDRQIRLADFLEKVPGILGSLTTQR